jgi:hypothetical protein
MFRLSRLILLPNAAAADTVLSAAAMADAEDAADEADQLMLLQVLTRTPECLVACKHAIQLKSREFHCIQNKKNEKFSSNLLKS